MSSSTIISKRDKGKGKLVEQSEEELRVSNFIESVISGKNVQRVYGDSNSFTISTDPSYLETASNNLEETKKTETFLSSILNSIISENNRTTLEEEPPETSSSSGEAERKTQKVQENSKQTSKSTIKRVSISPAPSDDEQAPTQPTRKRVRRVSTPRQKPASTDEESSSSASSSEKESSSEVTSTAPVKRQKRTAASSSSARRSTKRTRTASKENTDKTTVPSEESAQSGDVEANNTSRDNVGDKNE